MFSDRSRHVSGCVLDQTKFTGGLERTRVLSMENDEKHKMLHGGSLQNKNGDLAGNRDHQQILEFIDGRWIGMGKTV